MPPKASTSKAATAANTPLPLNAFLQHLCAQGLSMQHAMKVAGPMLKQGLNTPSKVAGLNEAALTHLNITDKDLRKQLLAIGKKGKKGKGVDASSPFKTGKKRGRDADLEEGLPDQAQPAKKMSLEIDEELDDFTLATKSVVVNRAPVMTAWSFVVAERLSFAREEALSLAQAYTEANAISKGVSLGIMSSLDRPKEAGSAQPFIELMGRKVPMISLQDGHWRGMVSGAMADPERAFAYIQKNFRQQIGSVIGAMRLLANSFTPKQLNEKGYGLYIEFRPEGSGWGEKSELRLANILNLRKPPPPVSTDKVKKEEREDEQLFDRPITTARPDSPPLKRAKSEDENALDRYFSSTHVKKEQKQQEEDEFDKLLSDDLDLSTLPDL